ncbi:MAG: acetamidase/formamidase family protein [Chloroflexia bacterium]
MGIALAEPGRHRTGPPSHAGGNMDIRQLTVGTTLYLPVQVPGALFSVGDAHGAQGDGEVSGTGIEMNATVTLRFSVEKGRSIRQPQFVTAGAPAPRTNTGPYFATTAHDPDLYQASREALRGMLDYLQARHGLRARPGLYPCQRACVDLCISQIVDAPNWTVSAFLPMSIFERANR